MGLKWCGIGCGCKNLIGDNYMFYLNSYTYEFYNVSLYNQWSTNRRGYLDSIL